jgi:hypothetical protein
MSGSSLRDRFLKTQPEEPGDESEEQDETDNPPPDPHNYEAFRIGQRSRRGEIGLLFYFLDGTIDMIYYGYIMRVTAYAPDIISLICTDCVYIISGANLLPLLPLMREQKIRFLQTFDPARHTAPAANDVPIIHSIALMSAAQWWERMMQRNEIRNLEGQA